jgi:DNA-binding transcriptional regulator YhcF (GntR family)
MTLGRRRPEPPYQQVAARLRAAILTKQLKPGDKLGSGAQLAAQYGVARMTSSRPSGCCATTASWSPGKGSGVYVRARTERPSGYVPHVEQAFTAPHVQIDFAGPLRETLAGALSEHWTRSAAAG